MAIGPVPGGETRARTGSRENQNNIREVRFARQPAATCAEVYGERFGELRSCFREEHTTRQ